MKTQSVIAVHKSATRNLIKAKQERIHLIKDMGVEGDAHMGKTVKHRSRVAKDPTQPNLRQVHLIHSELHDELREKGFNIKAGEMGENITTKGLNLLELPQGAILTIGKEAKIQITGLRNPCYQLNGLQEGLMKAVLDKDKDGNLIRKAGVMGIVLKGGEISAGDSIEVKLPEKPFRNLEPV